jgi:hypothetical protein
MATTENPAAKPDSSTSDVEAAVASLKDRLEPETMESLERLMVAREAELVAKLEAKLEAGAPLSSAVRSVVARLTQAPNWHQATVMFAQQGDDSSRTVVGTAMWSLTISVLMVTMQSMVAMAVLTGTFSPACKIKDHCVKGRFCEVGVRDR